MTINGTTVYEQRYYTERHIAAGAESTEKPREGIARTEARG